MKPKKLIRDKITSVLKHGEWEKVTDLVELNKLYILKIREELEEIKSSEFNDVFEFADLIEVAQEFASANGFDIRVIQKARIQKAREKGYFGNLALNNLNPNNPSNKIYFEQETSPKK